LVNRGDELLRQYVPAYRARRKYASELEYWQGELRHLHHWFNEGTKDWWGIPAPPEEQKIVDPRRTWMTNAVMTMHSIRPSYFEELQLQADSFRGNRVLEVGCGPLAPLLQFDGCDRVGLDPLIDLYIKSGWPMYDYDMKFINAYAENMPIVDSYFNTIIAVNSLDHVDNFCKVAEEMQRVLAANGEIYFEVEYHAPTVNEPQKLNDEIIFQAFHRCALKKVCERGKKDMFMAMTKRFSLLPNRFMHLTNDDTFVTFHGKKKTS
jgi:SAM-dependent methyltransferase